jgi:phosphoribosyl 1,2-cyclic phosphodiesterase
MKARFLGTGASGGTPGQGRSSRFESSIVVSDRGTAVLIDVTRHFGRQARSLDGIDAVLLTHAHRDACGGFAQLRRWWRSQDRSSIPVYAAAATVRAVRRRFVRLDHCQFRDLAPAAPVGIGPFSVSAVEVPHAREAEVPTYAYRIDCDGTLVYASDVARLTADLRGACAGADMLVIDGAMWRRTLFSHLTIDAELNELCRWEPARILLTQIGRTAPPHEALKQEVRARCQRARPAYDGLEVIVSRRARQRRVPASFS